MFFLNETFISPDLALRQNGGSKTKSKKKTKGVTFNENQEKPRPGFGMLMLQYILNHPLNRAIVLKKNLVQLEELLKVIQVSFLKKILQLQIGKYYFS